MDVKHYGKGAKRTPKKLRDSHFRLAATPSLVDWSLPYTVTDLPHFNQDGSSSCTAHATVSYCMALNKVENNISEEYSRRYIYSQSHLSGGGAYIWKAMSIPLKGLASEASVPDLNATEAIEVDNSLNSSAIIEARSDKYAVIPRSNIDQLAQVVKDYHGFVTGFNGRDDMFRPDGTAMVFTGQSEWGHAVYIKGFEIRNGVKCLRFHNSWSDKWGTGGDGFFTEEFVNSGLMFDCYTYAALEDIVPNMTPEEVTKFYRLAFYRNPDASELTYWTGKRFLDMVTTAIKDRAAFLAKQDD